MDIFRRRCRDVCWRCAGLYSVGASHRDISRMGRIPFGIKGALSREEYVFLPDAELRSGKAFPFCRALRRRLKKQICHGLAWCSIYQANQFCCRPARKAWQSRQIIMLYNHQTSVSGGSASGYPQDFTAITSISTHHSGRAREVIIRPVETGKTPFNQRPMML